MKIGFIVDGQSEFRSLNTVFSRINTQAQLLKPLYANLQPMAKPKKIVRAALPAVRILAKKKVQLVLIVIDYENRKECVPQWRSELEAAFAKHCPEVGVQKIRIVLKVRAYENWLVSDPQAIKAKKARFKLSAADEKKIVPNKADRTNAIRILNSSTQGSAYTKVSDSVGIMTGFDPYRAAKNSRSFRRLLRLVGCGTYSKQSKLPK